MNPKRHSIVIVDNSVHNMFKTIETLKGVFETVHVFTSEKEFLEYFSDRSADVILINLDLQPNDALVLLREIRQKKLEPSPFVIIFSDKQDDFVQELAFNSGADGFVNFHQKGSVLQLFLKNLLRRRKIVPLANKREVMLDADRYLIFKNGEAIQLPRKEFKLFELLYNSSEKFFSKIEIADLIWHDEAVANKRTIDVHIYNIRQFFGKRIIQSQKGKGYRINKKLIS